MTTSDPTSLRAVGRQPTACHPIKETVRSHIQNQMSIPSHSRRVVITGIGAITPLGLSATSTWRAMLAGKSGAASITRFDAAAYGTTFACEVKGFDPLTVMD